MRRPSTLISSREASAFVPSSVTTLPFTDTRPWVISSSESRREATPAVERIFCRRCPGAARAPFATSAFCLLTSDLCLFIQQIRPEVYQAPDGGGGRAAIHFGVRDERSGEVMDGHAARAQVLREQHRFHCGDDLVVGAVQQIHRADGGRRARRGERGIAAKRRHV